MNSEAVLQPRDGVRLEIPKHKPPKPLWGRGERTRKQAKGRGYSPPVNVVAVSGWRSGGVVRVRMV